MKCCALNVVSLLQMSLLEYRNRMKSRPSPKEATPRESSRSLFLSNIVRRTSTQSVATPVDEPPPPPPPPPPKTTRAPLSYNKSVSEPAPRVVAGRSASKDEDAHKSEWSSTATLAEQIRERNVDESEQRSLTERLRKEFGLENIDDSDKDKGECLVQVARCCLLFLTRTLCSYLQQTAVTMSHPRRHHLAHPLHNRCSTPPPHLLSTSHSLSLHWCDRPSTRTRHPTADPACFPHPAPTPTTAHHCNESHVRCKTD